MGDSFCNLGANNKISDRSEGSAGPEPGGSPVSSGVTTSAKKHNRTSKSKLIGAADTRTVISATANDATEIYSVLELLWRRLTRTNRRSRICVGTTHCCRHPSRHLRWNASASRHGGNGVVLHGALFKTELK
ncbi:hypothetical protein PF007_g32070 [Phytophthora fragariae]|uniref:Uncharacterized protein n=2 Tax=Phytophthora fragariae TaxID=53985 RepID=A0A6A3PQK9_9STRA|nr:hypothetical protein PF011_g31932 [Phytophthora fragariae]KAE9056202.1 hypothetical protein PF007_g32070 [Phytophthora fragariae]